MITEKNLDTENIQELENKLATLFTLYSEQETPPIIELQNIDHQPVAALYLSKFRLSGPLTISQTNNRERYYFYHDGVGIFFSYWKKITSPTSI
jgi:hypothetical protein